MNPRTSTIELYKEAMKFSSGHFTIFSETERETLHGHNYTVYAALTTEITDNGLTFDYRYYKKKLIELCRKLNRLVLLPGNSQYLQIEETADNYQAYFGDEVIPFLKRDVLVLPITNITIEELSQWFVDQLIEDKTQLEKHLMQKIEIKVYSGPGQSASSIWTK